MPKIALRPQNPGRIAPCSLENPGQGVLISLKIKAEEHSSASKTQAEDGRALFGLKNPG